MNTYIEKSYSVEWNDFDVCYVETGYKSEVFQYVWGKYYGMKEAIKKPLHLF